jgi:hypothetical protein
MWVQLGLLLVSALISYATRPKPPKVKPAMFGEFDFPVPDEGTPQIVVFGDVWVPDWCVIGLGNYRTEPIKK